MAFRATLSIDGSKELKLLHCSYALQRDTDPTGRPSSEVRGGTIQFEVESTDNTTVYEWMIDSYKQKNGSIKFFKRDEEATMKELQFTDAYIVSYSESIDAVGDNPMTENFVISAREISLGGGTHTNEWPM